LLLLAALRFLARVLRLLILLILLVELAQQLEVETRILVLGIELERALERADRGLDLPCLRERGAAVVVRIGRVEPVERCRALGKALGAKLRGAAPFGIDEQLRGALGVAGLQA